MTHRKLTDAERRKIAFDRLQFELTARLKGRHSAASLKTAICEIVNATETELIEDGILPAPDALDISVENLPDNSVRININGPPWLVERLRQLRERDGGIGS